MDGARWVYIDGVRGYSDLSFAGYARLLVVHKIYSSMDHTLVQHKHSMIVRHYYDLKTNRTFSA